MTQSSPRAEPKVPGAKGIRPMPRPCASQRINPCIPSKVLQIEGAIAPEIKGAGNKGENDGNPFGQGGEGRDPGLVPKNREAEDSFADRTPLLVAHQGEIGRAHV